MPARVPAWVGVWAAVTVLVLVLRATNAISSVPLCVFLVSVFGVLLYAVAVWRRLAAPSPATRFRQLVLVLLLVAVPSIFDPSTAEVNNIPRLVLLVTGATLILGAWGVDSVFGWRPRRLLNGLQWPLAGLLAWTALTTATSVLPRTSFIGAYASYDGLVLIATLVVVASALAESFSLEQIPDLVRVFAASTFPVLVYGAIQLHDVYASTRWDFVLWKTGVISNVFSTFGNPDHLGGLLVVMIPVLVVDAAVLARGRWAKALLWFAVGVALLLLLKSAARGAWLGLLVSGPLLVIGLWPLVRRRLRVLLPAAGVAVGAAALLAVGNSGQILGESISNLFNSGAGTSIFQRYGYWTAALRMGVHHPVVGMGPDVYGLTYTRYQDAALQNTLGNTSFVNGAHNVLLAWFGEQGFIGLVLMAAIFGSLIWCGYRLWRTWSRAADDTHRLAYVAVALVAGGIAYLVHAAFDVDQVGTWFAFFVVLALVGCMARSTWAPSTLVRLPSARPTGVDPESAALAEQGLRGSWPTWSRDRSPRHRRRRSTRPTVLAPAAAVAAGVIAAALVFWRVDALWRADHSFWAGTQRQNAQNAAAELVNATRINPWEPSYFVDLGSALLSSYEASPNSSSAGQLVGEAVSDLSSAVALNPYNAGMQLDYAEALIYQSRLQTGSQSQLKAAALAALHQAQIDNALDPRIASLRKVAETLPG